MAKIVLLSKEYIQQLNATEKNELIKSIMLNIIKNSKIYTKLEFLKLLKNIYRLGIKRITFLNGQAYKVLSTGYLKELPQ